jgi:hypothetical protein
MFGSIPFHMISRVVICGLAAANGVTAGDPNDVVIIIIIPMNNISFFGPIQSGINRSLENL